MSGGRAITCPACSGTIEVRAAGFSVNLACQHCGSLLDVSRPEVMLIRQHQIAIDRFALELGQRGTLFDEELELVGALGRSDQFVTWQEFLLFNPYLGYRWLVLADGDWQLGMPLADRPQGDDHAVIWRGQRFIRQDDDQPTATTAVAGEFYWRVQAGDTATATLFAAGDTVLSREVTAGEENWTYLVPVAGTAIAQAFGPPRRPGLQDSAAQGLLQSDPEPESEPGSEPESGLELVERDDLGDMFLMAGFAAILAALAMLILAGPTTSASNTVPVPVGAAIEPVKIGTISVTRPWQFVTFDARTNAFENRWIDLEYSLVDRSNEQSIDAFGLVEHYTGTDSDGRWTEGSYQGDTMLGHVPAGTYDVYVSGSAHGWPSDPPSAGALGQPEAINVLIEAKTGAMPWGMWWTLVIALFTWPLTILWWRHRD